MAGAAVVVGTGPAGVVVVVVVGSIVVEPFAALRPICEDPIWDLFAASHASVLLGDSKPAVVSASTAFAGDFLRIKPNPSDSGPVVAGGSSVAAVMRIAFSWVFPRVTCAFRAASVFSCFF